MAMKKILFATLLATSVCANAADSVTSSHAPINIENFVVKDIKIEGLQRVTLGAALLEIPVRVGDKVDSRDIADIIRSMYASGNYENVQVYRDNNVLVIKVQERPTIASISFLVTKP